MTYTTHSLILHDDYNTFVTGNPDGTANPLVANINTIWGTGYGSKGYGQTTTISPAAIGTTISATQWSALIAKLAPIAAHQGSTLQYIPQPTVGNTISVVGALNSTLLLLYNNSMNKSASGTDTNTYGSTYIAHGWKVQQVATHTVYFTNGPDAARYFFNAGGEIRFNFSRTGGTTTPKNTSWSTLLSQIGTVVFKGTSTTLEGNTGTPIISPTGYYSLVTGAEYNVVSQYATTAPYTVNNVLITATASSLLRGSNGDNGPAITFKVYFNDPEVDTYNDIIDGTLTSNCLVRSPETVYLANTWGNAMQTSSFAGDTAILINDAINNSVTAVTATTATVNFTNSNGSGTVQVDVYKGGVLVQTLTKVSANGLPDSLNVLEILLTHSLFLSLVNPILLQQ
jgi:hypothetical protein